MMTTITHTHTHKKGSNKNKNNTCDNVMIMITEQLYQGKEQPYGYYLCAD